MFLKHPSVIGTTTAVLFLSLSLTLPRVCVYTCTKISFKNPLVSRMSSRRASLFTLKYDT
jgi:hypothetical protein